MNADSGPLQLNIAALEVAAEFLDECLVLLKGAVFSDQPTPQNQVVAEARIAAWEEAIALDSSGYIARRVHDAGFDVREIMTTLPYLPPRTPGSGWGRDFVALIEFRSMPSPAEVYPFPEAAYAFGNALWPLCLAASAKLQRTCRVPELALSGFQGWLLSRLAEQIAPALYGEFATFRAGESPENRTGTYDRFCYHLQDGGLASFFTKRPALARVTTSIITYAVDAFSEFLARLHNDVSELRELTGIAPLALEEVEPGLSDPHNCGRTVFRVGFSGGAQVFYMLKGFEVGPRLNSA